MNDTDDILKALDDKEPEKKPTNWELWAALYFAEFIFVLLDAGSAFSVYWITGVWYYGLIVFFAGVIPLWLYTKTYTRPLVSKSQKKAALIGGSLAVGSVVVVAVFMAILNLAATAMDGDAVKWTEAGLGGSLVFILAVHGFINAYYFFTDEEIRETNKTDRMVARGDRMVKRIGVANRVASSTRREVAAKKKLSGIFSPEIVDKILEMMSDHDDDGIPDFMDAIDNRTGKPFVRPQEAPRATFPQKPMHVMAKDAEQAKLDEDPTRGQS